MARTRKLEVVLAGDAKGAVQAIDQVERKADGFGGKMATAGKIAATAFAAIGAAAITGAAMAVKAAVQVETGLREVNTLFGLSGSAAEASFKEMQAGVAGLSNEVGVAQNVLVGGLYQAISAGVPRENVFTFMEVAAKAAIAGVTDTETAIDGLTTIINAFGLEAADAQAVADSMFTAVKGGKTDFQQLSDAMFNVAPAAAALGIDFREVNAAIATLTASGTPTSVAITQIRAALTGLTRPSADMTEIFKGLGFESAQAAIEQEGLGFALDAVRDAAKGDVGQLQKLLGSVEAVAAANVIAGTGAEKFAQEMDAQGKAAGATQTAFEEMEESVGRQFERIKVRIQNALITVGNVLLPIASKVMDALADIFGSLSAWWRDNGPVIVAQAQEIFGRISAVVGSMVASIRQWLADNQGTIDQWRVRLSTIFTNVWAVISGFVQLVQVVWGIFGQTILDSARRAFDAIFRVVDGVLRVIKGVLDVFIGVFTGDWSRAWEGVKGITSGAWAAIKGMFSLALEGLRLVVSLMWEKIKAIFGGAFQFLKDQVHIGLLTIKLQFLEWAGALVGAAATAFGWLGPIGGKLREARDRIREFREETNRELASIRDKKITITVARIVNEHVNRPRAGDGPGNIRAAGKAIDRARAAATGLPVIMSSAYRTPARNRAVGGSPTSYHLDFRNPASDWVGPIWALDELARRLRAAGPRRELLWRVPNHAPGDNPHVHYAHSGGLVAPSWPTLAGLRTDERPAVLQVGERVIPKSGAGGASSSEVHLHFHGNIYSRGDAKREIISMLAEAKRQGYVGA